MKSKTLPVVALESFRPNKKYYISMWELLKLYMHPKKNADKIEEVWSRDGETPASGTDSGLFGEMHGGNYKCIQREYNSAASSFIGKRTIKLLKKAKKILRDGDRNPIVDAIVETYSDYFNGKGETEEYLWPLWRGMIVPAGFYDTLKTK